MKLKNYTRSILLAKEQFDFAKEIFINVPKLVRTTLYDLMKKMEASRGLVSNTIILKTNGGKSLL